MNEIIGPIYYTFSLDNDEMNYGERLFSRCG